MIHSEFIHLQKYLKQHRDINILAEPPYSLKIKINKELTLFKYSQFDSDFNIQLVREARGIIFDKNWDIICHPFHKIGNYGESYAYNNIDFKHSYIMEKIDGSILKIFFYNNKWNVGTNSTIYANTATISDNSDITFEDLFYDIISKEDFITITNTFNKNNTYLFELVHPKNKIVIDYGNTKELVHIGCMCNNIQIDTNIFYPFYYKYYKDLFKNYNIRFPEIYSPLNSTPESLIRLADRFNIKGNTFEGFVVTEYSNSIITGRVKIKSPKYVRLFYLIGNFSDRNVIKILINNEQEELEQYIASFGVLAEKYYSVKTKYNITIGYLLELFNKYYTYYLNGDKKSFALIINKEVEKDLRGILFYLISDNKNTIEKYFLKIGDKKTIAIVNKIIISLDKY